MSLTNIYLGLLKRARIIAFVVCFGPDFILPQISKKVLKFILLSDIIIFSMRLILLKALHLFFSFNLKEN